MIENIQPQDWMMVAAMIGATFHMLNGYLDKKQKNPDTKFEYPYLTKTVITILAMGLLFENIEVAELTLGGILFALLSGMGGNSAISKMQLTKK
jgi:hypothetical protein